MLDASQIVVLADENSVAKFVANEIFMQMQMKLNLGERFVLGCPGGRTPRETYVELGKLISANQTSLQYLYLVMMDDYVEKTSTGFQNVAQDAHFSCYRFAEKEIFDVLNAGLDETLKMPRSQLLTAPADDPVGYEQMLANLGIDIFILASGASDGHIAFNGPGSQLHDTTRIVELAQTTREDNLKTFPQFVDISEVPKYGITIGPATVSKLSKRVIMILLGESKQTAFNRITEAAGYVELWPATITVECQNPLVVADRAAANY